MPHAGYCLPADLLISGTRLPQGMQVTPESVISAAAEEIDAAIGMLYVTPVTVEEDDPAKRFDTLTLKRINALLASGRLITSMATGGEQNKVQAYGEYLLRFGWAQLKEIQNGTIKLTSATPIEQTDSDATRRGPLLVSDNQQVSLVDSFYQNFQPAGFAPYRQGTTDEKWPSDTALPPWVI